MKQIILNAFNLRLLFHLLNINFNLYFLCSAAMLELPENLNGRNSY